MSLIVLAAIAFTAAIVTLLCLGDPKRRRAYGLPERRQARSARFALLLAAALPGVGFAASGDAAAFFLWFGGSAVAGWCVALGFASRAQRS